MALLQLENTIQVLDCHHLGVLHLDVGSSVFVVCIYTVGA